MSAEFAAAFDAIEVFIRGLMPRAEVSRVGNEHLRVKNGTDNIRLIFDRDRLDDFEVVLGGSQSRPYSSGVKNDLYYPVYVALGMKGMISDFRIFSLLLHEEERDWLVGCQVPEMRFNAEVAKPLYESLIDLQSSLRLTLESDVEIPEVKAELRIVESLTNYYEEHQHLDCRDVHLESLSYLKAAALLWIQRLQALKFGSPSLRAKLAYDKKIYGVMQDFWVATPYNRIALPPAIHDLVAQRNRSIARPQLTHRPHVDIGSMLEKLDVRLRDRWRGAWAALQSDNPDRVSQATNSMVEVMNQVIDRVRGPKEFQDYLKDLFPDQAGVVMATRKWISEVKNGLQGVKHHPTEQAPQLAEDLMHQAEWIANLLLRKP